MHPYFRNGVFVTVNVTVTVTSRLPFPGSSKSSSIVKILRREVGWRSGAGGVSRGVAKTDIGLKNPKRQSSPHSGDEYMRIAKRMNGWWHAIATGISGGAVVISRHRNRNRQRKEAAVRLFSTFVGAVTTTVTVPVNVIVTVTVNVIKRRCGYIRAHLDGSRDQPISLVLPLLLVSAQTGWSLPFWDSSPLWGTNRLEFDWFVPKTGLQP